MTHPLVKLPESPSCRILVKGRVRAVYEKGTPLITDVRAERVLLAAKKLGREHAGQPSGTASCDRQSAEREELPSSPLLAHHADKLLHTCYLMSPTPPRPISVHGQSGHQLPISCWGSLVAGTHLGPLTRRLTRRFGFSHCPAVADPVLAVKPTPKRLP